jgi:hypothetical protein
MPPLGFESQRLEFLTVFTLIIEEGDSLAILRSMLLEGQEDLIRHKVFLSLQRVP